MARKKEKGNIQGTRVGGRNPAPVGSTEVSTADPFYQQARSAGKAQCPATQ